MRISDWSSDVCSSDLLSLPLRWDDDCRHIAAYAAIPRCQYRALLEFDEQRVHDRKIVLASKGRQIIGYRQCDGWQACLSIQGPKLVFHPMRIADQPNGLAMNVQKRGRESGGERMVKY